VAGDVVSDSDLPTDGTATYSGHAIGNVANSLNGQGTITYVATGDMNMSWTFNTRSGQFDITHFDTSVTPSGLSFGGALRAPGVSNGNAFTGVLSGGLPNDPGSLSGGVAGSFARSPGQISGAVPSGVIGNWNIGNSRYNATGIFAGSH
jgi:hypothetical protein